VLVAHAAWSAPASVDVPALLALVLFCHGWLRLRRRGRSDLADGKRAALFVAGLLVVLGGLLSPIHTIGENHLLWVHMLQHVLIGDLGIALMVAAVRGPLLVFLLPSHVLGPIARDRDVRAVRRRPQRDREADAAAPAADEQRLAAQRGQPAGRHTAPSARKCAMLAAS